MLIIEDGHIYDLEMLDSEEPHRLTFVNKGFFGRKAHAGVQNQEVLRALINRVQSLDREVRWEGNNAIVHHLRMALALHEARALIRKAEKGLYEPERILVGSDGHFLLRSS